MIDRIVCGVAGRKRGDGDLLRRREPLLRRLATGRPVGGIFGALFGPGTCVGPVEPIAPLFLISGPAFVVVGNLALAGREERPLLAALGRDRDDGLAELRASLALARDTAHHRLHDHKMLASVGLELAPVLTVSRRSKTEVGSEIKILVLRRDDPVPAGIGTREFVLEQFLPVDVKTRSTATAQEKTMFSLRQLHQRSGPEMRRHRPVAAYAGRDILLRPFKKSEDVLTIDLRDLGLLGPGIHFGHALFADLDEHFTGGDHLFRDRRRGRVVGVT